MKRLAETEYYIIDDTNTSEGNTVSVTVVVRLGLMKPLQDC